MQYNKKGFYAVRKRGYRSQLEETIAKQIVKAKHKLRYEGTKVRWRDLALRTYTPDFVLDNGIIIEAKGFWSTSDRRKHVEIKQQDPELDIRLVFENSNRKIRKGSSTSYAMWCDKKNIVFCDKGIIPAKWFTDKTKRAMPTKIISYAIEGEGKTK